MAKTKKEYAIYYESSGLKHYFQYDVKDGPSVIVLNATDAMSFTLKGAKAEIENRGKKWKYELLIH